MLEIQKRSLSIDVNFIPKLIRSSSLSINKLEKINELSFGIKFLS